MCGVVAVIGKDSASSLVIDGLKKLEYRGYDSSGIASLDNNKLQILKSKGKLNKLIDKAENFSIIKCWIFLSTKW